MDSKELLNITKDCLITGKPELIDTHFKTYLRARCLSPIRVPIYDSAKGTTEVREIPCGKCAHCISTKQSEWVARMYAHLDDYEYCYFVTLTYRSFSDLDLRKSIVSNELMYYLRDSIWHKDDKNFNKIFEWSPSVLVKSHYQNFLKRLRKNTGIKQLTYYICGEYGHTFGRPHWHLVLFSHAPITVQDVVKSWSLHFGVTTDGIISMDAKHTKSHHYVPIGNVDFHDLVTNGTITHESFKLEGQNMSADSCFRYVCKYVTKREFNNVRVLTAYNSIFEYDPIPEVFTSYFTGLDGKPVFHENEEYKPIITKYDENTFTKGLDLSKFPQTPREFLECYCPINSVSRGIPIGSLFLKTHIEQFKKGVYYGGSLQKEGFICPSYFRRKVMESIYGLRLLKRTDNCITSTKNNLPLLFRSFVEQLKNLDSPVCPLDYSKFSSVSSSIDQKSCLIDLNTCERYIFMCDCFGSSWFDVWKYNRSVRDYIKVRQISVSNFCGFYLKRLREYLDISHRNEQIRLEKLQFYDSFRELYSEYLESVATDVEPYRKAIPSKDLYHYYFNQKVKQLASFIEEEVKHDTQNYHLKHNRI